MSIRLKHYIPKKSQIGSTLVRKNQNLIYCNIYLCISLDKKAISK